RVSVLFFCDDRCVRFQLHREAYYLLRLSHLLTMLLFLYPSRYIRDHLSFPTRRSSDLRLYPLMYSVITSSLSGSSPHPWMIKTCAYRLHLPIDYIIFRNLSHIVVFFL